MAFVNARVCAHGYDSNIVLVTVNRSCGAKVLPSHQFKRYFFLFAPFRKYLSHTLVTVLGFESYTNTSRHVKLISSFNGYHHFWKCVCVWVWLSYTAAKHLFSQAVSEWNNQPPSKPTGPLLSHLSSLPASLLLGLGPIDRDWRKRGVT